MNRNSCLVACFLLPVMAATCLACLWDTDTLQMERLRFPGVLEIITGKFVRHSAAYYEWRIVDRKKKLADRPEDPALIDDLAVALAKLGRPQEGIPLLEAVLKQHSQRYETLSNLGTLLFFAARLEESKQMIRRALEVNPDAHFGRERYQLLLTEYLQQSEMEAEGVMDGGERYWHNGPVGFAKYVLRSKTGQTELSALDPNGLTERELEELRKATKGVLGMLHFANYTSPVLLEALGDLLVPGPLESNGTQLAARAYLSASRTAANPAASLMYRQMAEQAVSYHIDYDLPQGEQKLSTLEAQLAKEVKEAEIWFDAIAANERRWIDENRDVDRQFAAKYYDSLEATIVAAKKQVASEPRDVRLSKNQSENRLITAVVAIFVTTIAGLMTAVVVVAVWRLRSRKPNGRPASAI